MTDTGKLIAVKVSIVIRWILTVALLYGVYVETGPWTTLTLALLFLHTELPSLRDWLLRGRSGFI